MGSSLNCIKLPLWFITTIGMVYTPKERVKGGYWDRISFIVACYFFWWCSWFLAVDISCVGFLDVFGTFLPNTFTWYIEFVIGWRQAWLSAVVSFPRVLVLRWPSLVSHALCELCEHQCPLGDSGSDAQLVGACCVWMRQKPLLWTHCDANQSQALLCPTLISDLGSCTLCCRLP